MTPPLAGVGWPNAFRIIRFRQPPVDLFEDIADPADWAFLIAAEARTNPRLLDQAGRLDLVPAACRVSGTGGSLVMAPFTHVSTDHTSRFSDGSFGVYYCGNCFEVAAFETIHHHQRFMRATAQAPGWTADFRELVGAIRTDLHDLRTGNRQYGELLDPDDYTRSQPFAAALRTNGANGLIWPSVRYYAGEAAALFWPDLAGIPAQGRHLGCHWDGIRVDRVRNHGTGDIFAA